MDLLAIFPSVRYLSKKWPMRINLFIGNLGLNCRIINLLTYAASKKTNSCQNLFSNWL